MSLFWWFQHLSCSWADICQIFRCFFGKFKKSKRHSEINWPLLAPQVLESHLPPCMYSKDPGLKVNFSQNDYKTRLWQKLRAMRLRLEGTLGCFGNRSSVFNNSKVWCSNWKLQKRSLKFHKCHQKILLWVQTLTNCWSISFMY